jgi:SAM-dependent methyltransferase
LTVASPIPPPELVARIGGTCDEYLENGLSTRRILESLLPSDWSLDGKSVLDFGCGPGRTLSAFLQDGERAEFVGCDIHADSIAWATAELSPPFSFFVCRDAPPLAQPDQRFDLVYGMSVFTHITDQWSNWLVELHRVMRPGAIAVLSVLGPVAASRLLGIDWDDRIGMATMDFHKGWEVGGPSALLGEWWVREHWGRAFEILRFFDCPDDWYTHDFVVMRKLDVAVTAEELESVDPRNPREYASVVCNLEILQRQQKALGEQLRDAQRGGIAADFEAQQLRNNELPEEVQRLTFELGRHQAEVERLARSLSVIGASRSWRLTAPLRRARAIAGKRR